MFNKNLILLYILGLFFTFGSSINAQEKPIEKKESQMMMQDGDMQKCMDKIAADSTMRMQMMDKMMDQNKNDKEAMMKMCKKMMDNPEIHKMMKNMMHDEGKMDGRMMQHDMIGDSTKNMKK